MLTIEVSVYNFQFNIHVLKLRNFDVVIACILSLVNFTIHSVEGLKNVCYRKPIINNIKLFI